MSARERVEAARRQVATLINAQAEEIVWTSGATESNNLALKGFADALGSQAPAKRHIVTSAIEHKAILDTAAYLEARGFPVTYLMPDANGTISVTAVRAAMRADTGLVSLMLVNNEIGTLSDIAAIAQVVHDGGALFHVDAAQALGKTAIDVVAAGVDLMSMSAHKVYGPKGIGALYVRNSVALQIAPQMHGGGHERGLRSGTLATHQIVGMGAACAIAAEEYAVECARIEHLSQRLLEQLLPLEGVTLNAAQATRIPHTVSVMIDFDSFFPFMLADTLAVSSTSACNSAAGKPSHVLTAIGLSAEAAARTIRISLGRFSTEEDIDAAVQSIRRTVEQCALFAAPRELA